MFHCSSRKFTQFLQPRYTSTKYVVHYSREYKRYIAPVEYCNILYVLFSVLQFEVSLSAFLIFP